MGNQWVLQKMPFAVHQSNPTAPCPLPPGLTPGLDIWAVKCPAVGTKKEGKCRLLNPHCDSFHWSRGRIMVCQLMSAFIIALFLLSRDKPFILFFFYESSRQESAIKLKSIIMYEAICSELFNNMKGSSSIIDWSYMIIGLKSLRLNFIQILDQKKLDSSRQ